MQPFILHAHPGPNPWKIAILLEELSLPYSIKVWSSAEQKKPDFLTTLNPNGFTPVLEDPNTDLKIWESGAIASYILETYPPSDPEKSLTFPTSAIRERAMARQYSYFQATFQGPHLTNALFFTGPSPNPEARRRFVTESIRVLGVLETALKADEEGGKPKDWLVGGKCSYADLAFVPYTWSMPFILRDELPDLAKEFPGVHAWLERLGERESVKKVKADRARLAPLPGAPPASGQGK